MKKVNKLTKQQQTRTETSVGGKKIVQTHTDPQTYKANYMREIKNDDKLYTYITK